MGQWAQIGAAALQVGGGIASDNAAKGASKADRNAQERLLRLGAQYQRDADREDWERTRALWKDAANAMSPFSQAPHLQGMSQYTETPRVESPGTGFSNTSASGNPDGR